MPPEYEILYADKQVEKQLRDLPKAAFKKIDRELMKLKENPRSAKVRKIKGKEGIYELKVWPYRECFSTLRTRRRELYSTKSFIVGIWRSISSECDSDERCR